MVKYNKLVRDDIPEIIAGTGKKYSARILNDLEYREELKNKSLEELNEYFSAETKGDALEELADLLEVLNAFALYQGSDIEEVEAIRKKKYYERGGFNKKIFLVEVED